MKIYIAAYNYELDETLLIDGGSVFMYNLKQAFDAIGEETVLGPISVDFNGDVLLIQSEWCDAWYDCFKGKKIVVLGHFLHDGVYGNPHTIKSDLLITTWKGEITEGFNTHFIPHAYNDIDDNGNSIHHEGIVWCGNCYAMRDEGWLAGLPIEQIKDHPAKIHEHYRGNICPNILGDFQLGIVSGEPSRISNKPGFMLNERFWQVIGSGGILIQQYSPHILDFFDENDIIIARTKEEFQEKCYYYLNHREEGIEFYKRAREKVLEKHKYTDRAREILNLLK